jgi:hypothetical protein
MQIEIIEKYVLRARLREAEDYAIRRSPLRYVPAQNPRFERELEYRAQGKCHHGKYPRLLAEKMTRYLGFKVPTCNRCA